MQGVDAGPAVAGAAAVPPALGAAPLSIQLSSGKSFTIGSGDLDEGPPGAGALCLLRLACMPRDRPAVVLLPRPAVMPSCQAAPCLPQPAAHAASCPLQ